MAGHELHPPEDEKTEVTAPQLPGSSVTSPPTAQANRGSQLPIHVHTNGSPENTNDSGTFFSHVIIIHSDSSAGKSVKSQGSVWQEENKNKIYLCVFLLLMHLPGTLRSPG